MVHNKECCWFRDFGRYKFYECAYKHVKKRTLKTDQDDISKIIKTLEEQIKKREDKESLQTEKSNNIQKQQKETALEEKVRV